MHSSAAVVCMILRVSTFTFLDKDIRYLTRRLVPIIDGHFQISNDIFTDCLNLWEISDNNAAKASNKQRCWNSGCC